MLSDISKRDFVGSWGSTFIRPSLAIASIVLLVATAFAKSSASQFVEEDSFVK